LEALTIADAAVVGFLLLLVLLLRLLLLLLPCSVIERYHNQLVVLTHRRRWLNVTPAPWNVKKKN